MVWRLTLFQQYFNISRRPVIELFRISYVALDTCFPGVLLTSTPLNILSKSLAAFPLNKTTDSGERGIDPVALTIINPRKEHRLSPISSQRPPSLKSYTLPTELWGSAHYIMQIVQVLEIHIIQIVWKMVVSGENWPPMSVYTGKMVSPLHDFFVCLGVYAVSIVSTATVHKSMSPGLFSSST